jgi:hypothetical protein
VWRVAKRDGVNLPRGKQTTEHFAYLAARGKRGQEQLNVFHSGCNNGLQVDGGEH